MDSPVEKISLLTLPIYYEVFNPKYVKLYILYYCLPTLFSMELIYIINNTIIFLL